MLIKKPAVCGTLESSDVQITIRPNEGNGIRIELDSVVKTISATRLSGQCRRF